MRRPGEVLSVPPARAGMGRSATTTASNVIAFTSHYLRDKIDRPFGAQSIETVPGRGLIAFVRTVTDRFPIRVRLTLASPSRCGRAMPSRDSSYTPARILPRPRRSIRAAGAAVE